jgi:hypothetical protein
MNNFSKLVLIISIFLISACSTNSREALTFAKESCNIKKNEKTNLYELDAESNGFWHHSDPFFELVEAELWWKEKATFAATATQLDSKYEKLNEVTTTIYSLRSEVVTKRKQMQANQTLYTDYDWSFLDEYNQVMDKRRVECSAIMTLLSK